MSSRVFRRLALVTLIGFASLFVSSLQINAKAQCGGTGSPPPGCPGAIYRATTYDDYGTDDPYLWDGYDATTSPEGVLASTSPYNYTATVNAASDYIYQGGGYYDVFLLTGDCTWSNFSSTTTSAATTLSIPYSLTNAGQYDYLNQAAYVTVTVTIGTTTSTVVHTPMAPGSGTWTYSIPSGTDLSTVSVRVRMEPPSVYDNFDPQYQGFTELNVDMYIQ